MPAQRGKDLVLKLGDGASPENFTTVAGLRATTLSLSAAAVDATHAESEGRWREILAEAGLRQAQISGAGVFLSDVAAASVRMLFFSGAIRRWRVLIPDFGAIEGPFHLANLDYSGAFDGEAQVSLALESAGALSFVEGA